MARLNINIPEWQNHGVSIPTDKLQEGWAIGDRPPAPWFNNFWHLVSTAINEIQEYVNTTPRGIDFYELDGGPINYTASSDVPLETIEDGFTITIKSNVTCQDNPTIDIDGLGEIPLYKRDGSRIKARDLLSGWTYTVTIVNNLGYITDFKEKMLSPIRVTAESETMADGYYLAKSTGSGQAPGDNQWLPRNQVGYAGAYEEYWYIETRSAEGQKKQRATSLHDYAIYERNIDTDSVWGMLAQSNPRNNIFYEDVFDTSDSAVGIGLAITFDNTAREITINPGHVYTSEKARYRKDAYVDRGWNGLIIKDDIERISYDSKVLGTTFTNIGLALDPFGKAFLIDVGNDGYANTGLYQMYTVIAIFNASLTSSEISSISSVEYLFSLPTIKQTLVKLSDEKPLMDADESEPGTSQEIARIDHRHPHDTWAAPYNLTEQEMHVNLEFAPENYYNNRFSINYDDTTHMLTINCPEERGEVVDGLSPNWANVIDITQALGLNPMNFDASSDSTFICKLVSGSVSRNASGASGRIIVGYKYKTTDGTIASGEYVGFNIYAAGKGTNTDFKVYKLSNTTVSDSILNDNGCGLYLAADIDGIFNNAQYYFAIIPGSLSAQEVTKIIEGGSLTDRSLIGIYQELLTHLAILENRDISWDGAYIVLDKDQWAYDSTADCLSMTIEDADILGLPEDDKLFYWRLTIESKDNIDYVSEAGLTIQYNPGTREIIAEMQNFKAASNADKDVVIYMYWNYGAGGRGSATGGSGGSGLPYDGIPEMNGTGYQGSVENYSRGDHRHPTDTTRASQSEFAALKQTAESFINNADSEFAPLNHAANVSIYGWGNASNYGHLRLSDSTTSSSSVVSATAATPLAVKTVYDYATELDTKVTSALATASSAANSASAAKTAADNAQSTADQAITDAANARSQALTANTNANSRAPQSHAATDMAYGGASGTNFGHVKLSDVISGTGQSASSGIGASSYAVTAVYNAAAKLNSANIFTLGNTFRSTVYFNSHLDVANGYGLAMSYGSNSYRFYNSNGSWFLSAGALLPQNGQALGAGNYLWSTVWLSNNPQVVSDKRAKQNIEKIDTRKMEKVLDNLEGKSFELINASEDLPGKQFGFIAQEVEEAFKNAGIDTNEFPVVRHGENEDDFYSLNYSQFTPMLWNLVKAQNDRIKELEKKVEKICKELGV